MNEKAKQPAENSEVVRKLVVPAEAQLEPQEGDRSPTKVERDLDVEAIAKTEKATPQTTETVRKLVIPEE